MSDDVVLYHGDCRNILPMLPDASVDAVVCDPPYPCIRREYGYWTEAEWFDLMQPVVRECRRVLKSKGSAVFVLQPNSERVGRMRPWLWDFMAWCCREWNMVQDAWWWNYTAIPEYHSIQGGLMRQSIKVCVWLGSPDCYRDQDAVLWNLSDYTVKQALKSAQRFRQNFASGHGINRTACAEKAVARGGSSPFNLLPVSNARGHESAGGNGHSAGTPEILCDWWIRYLTCSGDTVLDPFMGTGTTGRAALRLHRKFIGIESRVEYIAIAERLLAEPPMPLFDETPDVPRQTSFL